MFFQHFAIQCFDKDFSPQLIISPPKTYPTNKGHLSGITAFADIFFTVRVHMRVSPRLHFIETPSPCAQTVTTRLRRKATFRVELKRGE